MKKFLLSLTALVLTILGANAETALFYATANPGPSADASYQLTGTVADQSYAAGGITISFTKVNSSKSNVTSNQVRFYQSDILTIKPTTAGSAVIKSIEISCASDAYASNLKLTSPDTGASTNNTTFTFTSNGGADEVVITANKQSRFTYLLVTYELTAPKQVEDVEISYELQNNNDALVTLTCPTEGATIYYGFSADAVTNEYTAPFTVSETCSVYAYSKKDDAESTLKNISINIYKSFKDIIAEAEKDEEITINGNFQLLYQNGNYIVITDGTSNLLLFDGSVADLAEGTKFSQIKGTVGDYNNLMEIMDVTLTEGGEGAAYTPAEYESLAGINYNDHLFDMIVLKGATISDKVGTRTNSTANITLGDDTVVMRNPFDLTYSNGSDYTITGFVWRYKDTLQFMPTAIEGGQVLQTVEEPVIKPSTRELKPDTEVSIECETDGAIIYYTIDGSDPTEDSTKYTDPFTLEGGDVTVKAIATHEGMLTSKIATREYHVWDPYCNVIDNSHDTPNKGEYRQHTCTVDGVDYAMLGIHHASQGIQMNNNATRTCYIIQTGDNVGYVLKSIEVDFNSNTNNIEFIVRGSNTPFSDGVAEGSAPNNIKTNGVVIGTISKDNPSVEFDRDYDYFAFYPAKNGVVYMNSVTVNYRDMKALDMNEAPVIPDNFADHFLFDESNWLTGELPTHTDWTAMYQYNDNDPIEADTTGILEDLTPASLHTLKIWYEHYYHDAKTEEKVFQHVSAPKYSITLAENTDLDFTNKIGEGVTVYFTLNGNEPEAAAANEPANAPAKKVLRAATENSVYTLDSEDDLNATHAITSEISHVVITPAVKEKMANDLKVMAVHESTGLKSAVTTSPLSDVTTGVEAIEAADADAVYFNLQGVKVTNPAPGAYIRIIDGKATKVLVK